ncbi:MAG: substrate-binding domain-containing protein, partial [Anaerolineales bacterium]|nr:substrate-binding domain-containing protein [Anaerolineales bacterium]
NIRLSSSNVGSLGGILALERRQAHLAGSHLLDPDSGEYNIAYIRKYLPDRAVRLVTLVHRQQGLLIRKGNPRDIRTMEDLARPDVVFVNRQRGAGTRILLDYQMDLMGIAREEVRGYNQEEFTHLAVAAAISSGRADCGLGIAAAADALDLDFIPLVEERYDLVIPQENAGLELLAPLFDVLIDSRFRNEVEALPGYSARQMGQMVAELP